MRSESPPRGDARPRHAAATRLRVPPPVEAASIPREARRDPKGRVRQPGQRHRRAAGRSPAHVVVGLQEAQYKNATSFVSLMVPAPRLVAAAPLDRFRDDGAGAGPLGRVVRARVVLERQRTGIFAWTAWGPPPPPPVGNAVLLDARVQGDDSDSAAAEREDGEFEYAPGEPPTLEEAPRSLSPRNASFGGAAAAWLRGEAEPPSLG